MQVNGVGEQTYASTSAKGADETAEVTQEAASSEVADTSETSEISKQSYSEEELQLLDIDGDGEITSEELNKVIQEHDAEMERVSNEYDENHKEEAGHAWRNKGAWSDKKSDYMNAKDILYRDEHPEYDAAKGLLLEGDTGDEENDEAIAADGEDNNAIMKAEPIYGHEVIIDGNTVIEYTDKDGNIVCYTDEDGNDIPFNENNEAHSAHGEDNEAHDTQVEKPKPSKIMKSKTMAEILKGKK